MTIYERCSTSSGSTLTGIACGQSVTPPSFFTVRIGQDPAELSQMHNNEFLKTYCLNFPILQLRRLPGTIAA